MKIVKLILILILSIFSLLSMAGEVKPYNQADFDKLAAEGKPVLIDIYANWCPTCKAQKPILHELMLAPAYKDVTMLTIDFDTEKTVLLKYKVAMQSTLIAFKGGKEISRTVGDTSRDGIEGLIKKTLN